MRECMILLLQVLFFIPNIVVLGTYKMMKVMTKDYVELQERLLKFVEGNNK